jgi:uncharacterized protein YndB with AHSA1/START domain
MASVDMTVMLNAPAQKVWDLIGDFDALPRWLPPVAKSEEQKEGNVQRRHLSLHGGGVIVERLERRDDRARRYSYTIESGPLPIAGYRSELSVAEAGPQQCRVHWSSTFEPKGGAEGDAVAAIRGVYQAGFDSLKGTFGG